MILRILGFQIAPHLKNVRNFGVFSLLGFFEKITFPNGNSSPLTIDGSFRLWSKIQGGCLLTRLGSTVPGLQIRRGGLKKSDANFPSTPPKKNGEQKYLGSDENPGMTFH